MIDKEFAKKQITRFAMLMNFPQKFPAALEDLVDGLMTATTEDMAKSVVDVFLDGATSESRCPMASEIKSACLARIREGKDWLPDLECPICKGDGEIRTVKGEYRYSKQCTCFAWRIPPDWAKLAREQRKRGEGGIEEFDIAGAAAKLRGN